MILETEKQETADEEPFVLEDSQETLTTVDLLELSVEIAELLTTAVNAEDGDIHLDTEVTELLLGLDIE